MVEIKENIEKEEAPEELDERRVIFWSEHYRQLEGVDQGDAIRTKAQKWLQANCIEYDSEEKCFLCHPIEGYNKTIHEIKAIGNGEFSCSCQFYNRVCVKNPGLICSHILAVYLWLKIYHWNKGHAGFDLTNEKIDEIIKNFAEQGYL